jgi:hypothetical protein
MDITQYKDVYVYVEQRGGRVQSVALELLGKARELADTLGKKSSLSSPAATYRTRQRIFFPGVPIKCCA